MTGPIVTHSCILLILKEETQPRRSVRNSTRGRRGLESADEQTDRQTDGRPDAVSFLHYFRGLGPTVRADCTAPVCAHGPFPESPPLRHRHGNRATRGGRNEPPALQHGSERLPAFRGPTPRIVSASLLQHPRQQRARCWRPSLNTLSTLRAGIRCYRLLCRQVFKTLQTIRARAEG